MGNKNLGSMPEGSGGSESLDRHFKFENRPVAKWKYNDLLELLEATGFGEIQNEFFELCQDGKSLSKLNNLTELEEKIKDPKRGYLFRVLIHRIKMLSMTPKEKFRFKFFVVLMKAINNMSIEVIEEEGVNYDDFIANCEVLSEEELMKENFLIFNESGSGGAAKLRVKIIITENVFTARQIMARRLVSPVVSYFPKLRPEFGFFHTAIIIGGIYLQWTDSELVIPKDLKSSSVFLAMGDEIDIKDELDDDKTTNECNCLDFDPITQLKLRQGGGGKNEKAKPGFSLSDVADILAEKIVKWNTKYRYKSVGGGDKGVGNCQDFVKDIADALNINLDPSSGALRHFIEKIRKKGKYKLSFKVPEKMKQGKLGKYLTQKKYVFDTHEELDNFVYGMYEADKAWKFDFAEELSLLKAFDRAYWLRHFKDPSNEKFKQCKRGCVFEDPRETKSFV